MTFSLLLFVLVLTSTTVTTAYAKLTIANFTDCFVAFPNWIGDGYCDGGDYNTVICGYDGGDCEEFNNIYPMCAVEFPFLLGNGRCNIGSYNTLECGYDGGDCLKYNSYPHCNVSSPDWLGDGLCDMFEDQIYHTAACGYDLGDCFNVTFPDCLISDATLVGNGICDGGVYNTAECGYDGGDCFEFNSLYPNCTVSHPYLIGNGECEDESDNIQDTAYNTMECGYDGGDCENRHNYATIPPESTTPEQVSSATTAGASLTHAFTMVLSSTMMIIMYLTNILV